MSWVKATVRLIHAWRHPDEIAHDVEAELRFHIEMRVRANIEDGMRPDEARLAALQSFGDFDRIKGRCCEISGSLPFGQSLIMGMHLTVACLAGGAALWAVNKRHDNLSAVLCQLTAIAVLMCSFLIGRNKRTVTNEDKLRRSETMQKMLLVVTLLGAATISLFAQTAARKTDTSTAGEQAVLKLTQEWLDAEERHDRVALDRIIADDFLGTGPGGNTVSKVDVVPREGEAGGLSISGQDLKARVFDNAAVVTGRGVGKRPEQPELRFTVIFVKRGDRWQMVAGHLSGVPPPQ